MYYIRASIASFHLFIYSFIHYKKNAESLISHDIFYQWPFCLVRNHIGYYFLLSYCFFFVFSNGWRLKIKYFTQPEFNHVVHYLWHFSVVWTPSLASFNSFEEVLFLRLKSAKAEPIYFLNPNKDSFSFKLNYLKSVSIYFFIFSPERGSQNSFEIESDYITFIWSINLKYFHIQPPSFFFSFL